ncbi:peptidylprolyl isomerase [Clostridium carnis]
MLSGCSKSKKSEEVQRPEKPENLPIATIVVKGYGTMEAELYPHIAPNTVNNFISLANKGFYNGLTFHRIIKGFMIQGGDPKGTGEGGPGYSIKGEFKSNGFENNLKHELGVLSMARTKIPDSAGSQFFIMTGTSSNLDGEYAAFGKIISGIDILEKVGVVKTSSNDRPVDEVIIESITVDTKGTDYKEPVTIK